VAFPRAPRSKGALGRWVVILRGPLAAVRAMKALRGRRLGLAARWQNSGLGPLAAAVGVGCNSAFASKALRARA
jgi:hypothetical protein